MTGEWTKEEAEATEAAVEELFKALSKPKQREYLGHYNDILCFVAEAKKHVQGKVKVAK